MVQFFFVAAGRIGHSRNKNLPSKNLQKDG
jgi:hypothetical protein